jgi:hypothetical protein
VANNEGLAQKDTASTTEPIAWTLLKSYLSGFPCLAGWLANIASLPPGNPGGAILSIQAYRLVHFSPSLRACLKDFSGLPCRENENAEIFCNQPPGIDVNRGVWKW